MDVNAGFADLMGVAESTFDLLQVDDLLVNTVGGLDGDINVETKMHAHDIRPKTNLTYSLGSPTHQWVDVYAQNYIASALTANTMTLTAASSQLTLGSPTGITLSAPTPAAPVTYTIPDVGVNTSFTLLAGTQTISGLKTFSNQVRVETTSNQLRFGSSLANTTITVPTPAASRVLTIPDVGADTSFVMLAGAQTIGGAKTFSSPIVVSPTSNQIVLGVGNTVTITAPTPAASRTHTIPDVGSADFVMTGGNQTIGGAKTFTGTVSIASLSSATLAATATSNQIVLGTGNTVTITASTPAASRVLTIPDVGSASFMMTDGIQTAIAQKNLQGGVTFLTSGGTPTILNYYEEFTFATTFTGPFNSGNVSPRVVRIGNSVWFTFQLMRATATVSAVLTSSVALPTRFRPLTEQYVIVDGTTGGINAAISVRIQTNGILVVQTAALTNFPSGALCGVFATTFMYNLVV